MVIAFLITADTVTVLRILYGGRDLDTHFPLIGGDTGATRDGDRNAFADQFRACSPALTADSESIGDRNRSQGSWLEFRVLLSTFPRMPRLC